MGKRYFDIALVRLEDVGNLRGVFKAPYGSVHLGDMVDNMDGKKGTVIALMCAAQDMDSYSFLEACFGNPDLPLLKGKTEYHEFLYEGEPES